jgi:hypothetical protein
MRAAVIHVMEDAAVSVLLTAVFLLAPPFAACLAARPQSFGCHGSAVTEQGRDPAYYRERLTRFRSLSHITFEVQGSRPALIVKG